MGTKKGKPMVAKNDITGDSIQTKDSSEAYRNNYDLIFRKKETAQENFDVESPDPAERSWYYDSHGIKRKK
jgi:hypothetical protein